MFNMLKMMVLLLVCSLNQSVFAQDEGLTIDIYSEEESAKIESIESGAKNVDNSDLDDKMRVNRDRYMELRSRRGSLSRERQENEPQPVENMQNH